MVRTQVLTTYKVFTTVHTLRCMIDIEKKSVHQITKYLLYVKIYRLLLMQVTLQRHNLRT